MNRQVLIEQTVSKIRKLPDVQVKEINDFADFLLSRINDQLIREGVKNMMVDSKSFYFLKDEEDLYSVEDLKER